jgi:D-alanyl-D-alanine dipeptidase
MVDFYEITFSMKKRILLFTFLASLIFSFFLSAPVDAAGGCCIISTPVVKDTAKSTLFSNAYTYDFNKRTYSYEAGGDAASCRAKNKACGELEECLQTQLGKSRGCKIVGSCTEERNAFYVERAEQCGNLNAAKFYLESSWCCVPNQLASSNTAAQAGKLNCESITRQVGSCKSNLNLYKRSCSSVSFCQQSAKPIKDLSKEALFYNKQLEKLKNQIKTDTEKPVLGTELPGFGGFSQPDIYEPPGQVGEKVSYITIPWIAELIAWMYSYGIGIAGIIAVVMVMVGGFMWILSGGDARHVQQAKSYITSSVVGLVLVMTAYMILRFINPSLVNLSTLYIEIPKAAVQLGQFPQCVLDTNKIPNLKKFGTSSYCHDYTDTTKFINLRTDYQTKLAPQIQVPRGQYTSYATPKLAAGLLRLKGLLEKDERLVITNTTRSLDTQSKLCNCWESYKATNYTSCPSNCSSCAKATPPKCYSTGHGSGNALDIYLKGKNSTIGTLDCGRIDMKYNCSKYITSSKAKKQAENAGLCKKYDYLAKCQNRLHDLMIKAGFKGISNEWWHYYMP